MELVEKKRNIRVRLRIRDWEKMFKVSMKKGRGFIITDRHGTEGKERTEHGIYSPLYGTTWGDENAFAEKITCKCRSTIGKENEGEICEACNTVVKFRDNDLKITGWFELEDEYLIHPNMFKIIESLVGPTLLANMLQFEKSSDIKGKYEEPDFEEIAESKALDKYENIGMVNFRKHFDEIMAFFVKKKKMKRPEYEFIMEHRDKIFVKHIPVYSALLRPTLVANGALNYHDINSKYESLGNKVWRINNEKLRHKDYLQTLFGAQKYLMAVYEMTKDSISQKDGDIRGKIMGGRWNYTGRCVIIPLSGTKIDEISLPYRTFMEIYKPEIINLLMKFNGITIYKALEKWNEALLEFNPKVYQIMLYLIEHTKSGLYVFINRNPTIAYGSKLAMRVTHVNTSLSNYCMGIPINVLGPLRGDFDGDVLNIFGIKGNKNIQKANSVFNPRTNMHISRTDGKFNMMMALVKDQMIALHQFNAL